MCVTRYNIGDIPATAEDGTPGPANGGRAPSVKWMSTSKWCSEDKPLCCWGGKDGGGRTGQATNCGPGAKDYGGCHRTLCTWHAADVSCKNLAYGGTKAGDWRLPTIEELKAWSLHIDEINTNKGNDGLLLCHWSKGLGAWQCENTECCSYWGAKPYNVWSSKIDESLGYGYNYHLVTGDFIGPNGNAYGHPNSTRCVLERIKNPYSSYSGGGGGGAPFIENYTIPQALIQSAIGGKIILYSAAGAKGGAAADNYGKKAGNGENGGESYIEVRDKSNKLVWGLKVPGGNGAQGAGVSIYGEGGAQKAQNSCQVYENGSWKNTNCTGYGQKGASGNSANSADENTCATGGNGGGARYNTQSYAGGGIGGSNGVVNGSTGTLYGAGGGGGTVGFNSDGGALKGKGGNGANGVVEIKYNINSQAAAGGGGGGGAFAKVRDIIVTPGSTYTIRVGGGGQGAGASFKGGDGGESAITFGTLNYTLKGGKGGNAGTNSATSVSHGTGGAGGSVTLSSGYKADSEYHNGRAGSKGTNATDGSKNSWGGRGGESAIKAKGGCGGLYTNLSVCTNPNVDGISIPFEAPVDVIQYVEYGSAGAGGGGGGWHSDMATYPNPGRGGNGQDGYVYIYWAKQN